MALEQLLKSQGASHLNRLLFACSKPRYLQLQKQKRKVTKRLEIILAAFRESSELIIAGEGASIIHISNLQRMSLYINISLRPLEIDHHQLPLFANHEVLWLYVSVEVAAIMDELQYLQDIDEDGFGGKSYYAAFVFLHDHVGAVLSLEVQYSVYTRPFSFCDVLPEAIVDLENPSKSLC